MADTSHSVVHVVTTDLHAIFGARLHAVVSYGWRGTGPVPTLALVESLSIDDLNACATRAGKWRRSGASAPLLLTRSEFARSLDAFPIEYGEIIQHHEVVYGQDPFDGLTIRHEDLRRACEVQAKSHLLHLREDFIESGGQPGDVDALVRESAPGFVALLRQLARLDGTPADSEAELVRFVETRLRLDPRTVGDLITIADGSGFAPVDAVKLFPAYLDAMHTVADFADRWRAV